MSQAAQRVRTEPLAPPRQPRELVKPKFFRKRHHQQLSVASVSAVSISHTISLTLRNQPDSNLGGFRLPVPVVQAASGHFQCVEPKAQGLAKAFAVGYIGLIAFQEALPTLVGR